MLLLRLKTPSTPTQVIKRFTLPVETSGSDGRDRSSYGERRNEVVDRAVSFAEDPVRFNHERKVEQHVEQYGQQIGNRQVQQE